MNKKRMTYKKKLYSLLKVYVILYTVEYWYILIKSVWVFIPTVTFYLKNKIIKYNNMFIRRAYFVNIIIYMISVIINVS